MPEVRERRGREEVREEAGMQPPAPSIGSTTTQAISSPVVGELGLDGGGVVVGQGREVERHAQRRTAGQERHRTAVVGALEDDDPVTPGDMAGGEYEPSGPPRCPSS